MEIPREIRPRNQREMVVYPKLGSPGVISRSQGPPQDASGTSLLLSGATIYSPVVVGYPSDDFRGRKGDSRMLESLSRRIERELWGIWGHFLGRSPTSTVSLSKRNFGWGWVNLGEMS
jgi:hypothetical protein